MRLPVKEVTDDAAIRFVVKARAVTLRDVSLHMMVNAEREGERGNENGREAPRELHFCRERDSLYFAPHTPRFSAKKARSSFRSSELQECGKMAGLLVRQADHLRNDESY